MTLRDVLVVPFGTISRTSSGKVQRGRMRALYVVGELTSDAGEDANPRATEA